jgi:hypothetical protein
LFGEHLAKAAEEHDVLSHKQFVAAEDSLREIKPWPAVGDPKFLSNIEGENKLRRCIASRDNRKASGEFARVYRDV